MRRHHFFAALVGLGLVVALLAPSGVEANHPVLVEGNNAADGGPDTTVVPPGTSGDYDGDGRVGTAEDTDNATDRIFGTLTAALLGVNGGANANGHVLIVTSGRFAEQVRIPNVAAGQATLNGVTIIEGAPGVQAHIDAVLSGDGGNGTRVAAPGVVIDTPATDRAVILRNLVIRNYSVGLQVLGNARVTVENCRFDSNLVANVQAGGSSRLILRKCSISAGGMRFGTGGGPPAPGHGVQFTGAASGCLSECSITSNTAAGVINQGIGPIRLINSLVCDNTPDLAGNLLPK